MLKILRNKKTAKKIWLTLAIIIVPAFVFWGAGGLSERKQKGPGYAGKIFGKKVSFQEYTDSYDAVKNQAIIRFGDNFQQIQKYLNLESQAWDRLLLLNEAKKYRIKVTDQEVVDLIESYPFFQRNGRFNKEIYSQLLQYYFRTLPRAFEEQIRQSIILSKLYDKITGGVTLSGQQIKQDYAMLNEKLNLEFISASPEDFTKDIKASDTQLQDYYNTNRIKFKQPSSIQEEAVIPEFASIKDLVKKALVSDKSTLLARQKIESAMQKIELNPAKADFNKIAGQFGLKSGVTGDFKLTDKVKGVGDASQLWLAANGLKENQTSQIIDTGSGFYIVKLKNRLPIDEKKFQSEKENFTAQLLEQKKQEAFVKFLDGLKKKAQLF